MKFEEVMKLVDESIDKPFLTAKFGDNWKDNARGNPLYDYEAVLDIAWKQGRRAIVLELILKDILKEKESI